MNNADVENIKVFTKIPNFALYKYGEYDVSIVEQFSYNCKVVQVLDYLYRKLNRFDWTAGFCLEGMIEFCGYKPDTHRGQSNDIFKSILLKMIQLGYISTNYDITKIKPKNYLECKLTIDYSSNFSIIYDDVRDKIYSVEGVDKAQLFAYYCYINARMHRRSKDEGVSESGGQYEYTYFGFKGVYDNLKITDKAIVKYNDILVSLDLIRYENFGTYYFKDDPKSTTRLTPNFYTLFDGDEGKARKNLVEGYKLYKIVEGGNRIFTDKPLVMDNRSIGGEKGSLMKKEMNGTITTEETERLKQIEEIMDDSFGEKNEMREILQLIEDDNDNMTLSEFFLLDGNSSKGDKYLDIEKKLGVIDKNDELCVDFGTYKEVMLEYKGYNVESLKVNVSKSILKQKCGIDDEFCELLA